MLGKRGIRHNQRNHRRILNAKHNSSFGGPDVDRHHLKSFETDMHELARTLHDNKNLDKQREDES